MFILCVGPDLYRALEKANELESAFRHKYDLDGSSTEQLLQEGTELVDAVAERVNTVSLFTPRRFLRVRDLLNGCPKGRVTALEKALSVDPENVIVVSVEKEAPPDVVLRTLSAVPKFLRYDFPRLDVRGCEVWLIEQAKKLGYLLSNEQIKEIIEQTQGDSWQAMFLLLQGAAGGDVGFPRRANQGQPLSERNTFDWADAYVKQDPEWRRAAEEVGAETLIYPLLSQMRAFQRVQAGDESNVPSFVVRKLKGMTTRDSEERFLRLLESVMLQRQGFLREDELATII